jgi:hypothetical protein
MVSGLYLQFAVLDKLSISVYLWHIPLLEYFNTISGGQIEKAQLP